MVHFMTLSFTSLLNLIKPKLKFLILKISSVLRIVLDVGSPHIKSAVRETVTWICRSELWLDPVFIS